MATSQGRHRVSIIRDISREYPQILSEVFVVGDAYEEAAFAAMFVRAGCTKAPSIEKADIVVFTGGPDVDPVLYGERPHPTTQISPDRDESDINAYVKCIDLGIPMFGVCRGAQFGHVMNGGKLYQHVDQHHGDHYVFDVRAKKSVRVVSSVHHQTVRPNSDMEVIADVHRSQSRWLNDQEVERGRGLDIEAFFYRDTCFFGVQGHPEYRGYNEYMEWCLNRIYELLVENPDLELRDGNRRIKKSLLETRKKSLSIHKETV